MGITIYVLAAKTCPRVEGAANMRTSITRYSVGGSVTYTCDEHFTMVGKNKRICLSSGDWSGVAPICHSKERQNRW